MDDFVVLYHSMCICNVSVTQDLESVQLCCLLIGHKLSCNLRCVCVCVCVFVCV